MRAVPGALRAVILPFLARARRDRVPAWLEAVSPRAVAVYERCGFRVVDVVVVGRGAYGPDGWPRHGGPGVTVWGMIYDPHLRA